MADTTTTSGAQQADLLDSSTIEECILSFNMMDADQTGFITDKDSIYGLCLSMGVTFNSEEAFTEALKRAIITDTETTTPT